MQNIIPMCRFSLYWEHGLKILSFDLIFQQSHNHSDTVWVRIVLFSSNNYCTYRTQYSGTWLLIDGCCYSTNSKWLLGYKYSMEKKKDFCRILYVGSCYKDSVTLQGNSYANNSINCLSYLHWCYGHSLCILVQN